MCTFVSFTDETGKLIAGRNFDWGCSYGEYPVVTGANWQWESLHEGSQTTKSPIIGMAVEAKGMPLYYDAGNADGLYCAGLSFAAGFGQYSDQVIEGKHNVASFELPLWIVSNFSTVDEAEEALKNLNITSEAAVPGLDPKPMHWVVTDKNRTIVVEQMADGCHVHEDGFGVLTNQPDFPYHYNNMRLYLNLDTEWPGEHTIGKAELTPLGTGPSMMGLPGDPSSASRFVRAAILNANYPAQKDHKSNVVRLFKELENVSMYKGYCKMEDGSFEYTIYSGGYSEATRSYYWNTYDEFEIKSACLDDYKDLQGVKALAE